MEKTWGGHAGVSQATALKLQAGKFIPEILGQHHGYSPNLVRMATDTVFGGNLWQEQREKLTAALKTALDCDWPCITNPLQARVLSGLTTVADWIGSSSWFEDPHEPVPWQLRIAKALDHAGFIAPQLKLNLNFTDIFNFSPRDPQQKLSENTNLPGVYIFEAPMGLGKTEAALYAAYRAMAAGKATGLYFALPTQLTSDKIYDRVNYFLSKILSPDCVHQQALLVHNKSG